MMQPYKKTVVITKNNSTKRAMSYCSFSKNRNNQESSIELKKKIEMKSLYVLVIILITLA